MCHMAYLHLKVSRDSDLGFSVHREKLYGREALKLRATPYRESAPAPLPAMFALIANGQVLNRVTKPQLFI